MLILLESKKDKNQTYSGVIQKAKDVNTGVVYDWLDLSDIHNWYYLKSAKGSHLTFNRSECCNSVFENVEGETVVIDLFEGISDCTGFNRLTLEDTYGVDISCSELNNYNISVLE